MRIRGFLFIATLVLTAGALQAQDGWRRALVDPSTIKINGAYRSGSGPATPQNRQSSSTLAMQSLSTPSGPLAAADAVTPYIQSLADALGHDPVRIYEWVTNNIDFVPYNGLKRGATLTALEKSGNDFDTSALLVALLKASGYTGATYRFGNVTIDTRRSDGIDAEHWLGADKSQISSLFDNAGCSYGSGYGINYFIPDSSAGFPHVWVVLSMSGGDFVLDPSFKLYKAYAPVSPSTFGYSSTAAMTAAAGTLAGVSGTTASSVYTMTTTGKNSVRSTLNTYATALSNYAQATLPDQSGIAIAGGKTIVPQLITTLPTSLPVCFTINDSVTWSQIPTDYAVQFSVSVGNISYSCYTAELQGQKLAVWFQGSAAQLWLDDTQLGSTETGFDANAKAAVTLSYTYNSATSPSWMSQSASPSPLPRTGCYVVTYGFDKTLGRLYDRLHRQADYVAQGYDPQGRQLRTENLYIMALQYLNQASELNAMSGGVAQSNLYLVQHAGIAGQTTSPYVDLPVGLLMSWPKQQKDPDFFQNLSTSGAWSYHVFLCANYWNSMLEHATIEQSIPGAGVSTVKMIQRAVELSTPIYLIGNQADYNVIKPSLTNYPGTYMSADEVAKIETVMAAGGIVMLPKNSAMAYNSYHGTGYMLSNNAGTVTMGIAGGLAGGFSTITADISLTNPYSFDSYVAPVSVSFTPPSQSIFTLADPVEMTTGAFYHTATDLTLGDSNPHGLSLSRMYSSAKRTQDPVGLGKGWTHSYDMHIDYRHPNDFDFQRASASDVAPFVVGFQTILDTFSETSFTAKTWTVPAIVASWIGDQLINTRAVITLGERATEFTVLPDGTFAPPPGLAATLTKNATSGKFTLAFRKGNTITFNAIGTATTSGKFTTITDSNNSGSTAYSLTATYLTSGQLNKVTDSYTRYLQFAYDGSGHLSSVTDSASPARTVSYGLETTGSGNAYTFTDAEGKKSWYYYDSKNRIIQVVDALGRTTVSSVYDAWDHVIEQRTLGLNNHFWSIGCISGLARNLGPDGNTDWYYFDGRGRQFGQMNGKKELSRTDFDGADRTIKTTTPVGEVTSYIYNKNNEVTRVTNNVGNVRLITPASDDSVTTPRTENNFEGQPTVTTYYAYHKPQNVTSPGGIKAEYQYDTRGRISKLRPASFATGQWISYAYSLTSGYVSRVTATYPDSTREISDYNAQGDFIQTIDRRGKKSTVTYNNRRQPVQVAQWTGSYTAASTVGGTPPAGSLVKTIGYDDNGDKSTETVDGKTNSFEHDALGNLIEVWGPDGVLQADRYYDERNLLSSSIDAYGFETSYVYDAAQRLDHAFDTLVRPTFYTYDADGRGQSVTSPRGYASTDTYDAAGNKWTTTDAKLQVITYGYDKDGRPKTITNRRSKTYTIGYDDTNRLKTTSTPLGKTTIEARNTQGLVSTVTEPSNQTANNTVYDNEGRVLTQVFKDASGTVVATTTFAYYANGLLNTVTETPASGAVHTTSRTYDDLNRLYSYSDGEGNTIGYRYDNSGNLSQLIYPDGKTVNYGYDVYNRLWHVTDWSSRVTTYTYDEGGRLTRIDRPNGTWRKMVYDAAGQLRQAEEHQIGTGGALLGLQALRYDNAGKDQNFRVNDGEITWNYTFPAPQAFTLPTDTASYDDDNRLLSWSAGGGGSVTPVFDADGNMTSGPLPDGTAGTYTYDTRNRLTATAGHTYRYNPEGHRVQVDSTTYVVDPSASLSRVLVRNNGGTITRYVWGVGLIYEETGTSTKTYHPNFQGSTVALTDDGGNVTDRVEYSPYGGVTYRTGTSDTPFLLHGALGVMTDTNGLNYMRARYYNPRIMRFLNADPIGFAGGMNGYAFGGNNPLSNVDPSGFCSQNSGSSFGSTWAASAGDRAIQSSLNEYAMGAVSQAVQSENRYWTNPDTGNTEAVSSAFIASNPGDAAVQYFNRIDMAKEVAINAAIFVATDGIGELAFAGRAAESLTAVGKTPFAMGLDSAGLDEFAFQRGATTFKQFPDGSNWQTGVLNKLADPETTVHFNLDSVDVWQGVQRASAGVPGRFGATDWELLQIKQNPQFWDSLQFWKNGSPAPNPFQ